METPFNLIGKYLIIFGIVFIVVGVLLIFFNKIPYLGKLPGDFVIEKKNIKIFLPVTTLIIINLILLLISWLLRK